MTIEEREKEYEEYEKMSEEEKKEYCKQQRKKYLDEKFGQTNHKFVHKEACEYLEKMLNEHKIKYKKYGKKGSYTFVFPIKNNPSKMFLFYPMVKINNHTYKHQIGNFTFKNFVCIGSFDVGRWFTGSLYPEDIIDDLKKEIRLRKKYYKEEQY